MEEPWNALYRRGTSFLPEKSMVSIRMATSTTPPAVQGLSGEICATKEPSSPWTAFTSRVFGAFKPRCSLMLPFTIVIPESLALAFANISALSSNKTSANFGLAGLLIFVELKMTFAITIRSVPEHRTCTSSRKRYFLATASCR